ncbi:hypothetical protein [uncultured Maricaulis sp.]|uniref:hypothetical protein n=1 Tax=uncultured Maricaulis sp. TaxID=174710 RepID=UPI0030D9F641
MRSAMEWLAHSEDDGYQLSKAKVGTELDLPRTRLHIEELMRQAEEYGEPTAGFADLLEQCVEGNEAAIPALLAASACCQDYYGTESYGFHPRFQLACIRLAAKAWLAENPPLISDEAVS